MSSLAQLRELLEKETPLDRADIHFDNNRKSFHKKDRAHFREKLKFADTTEGGVLIKDMNRALKHFKKTGKAKH